MPAPLFASVLPLAHPARTRVLIVHSQAEVARGLAIILGGEDSLRVVSTATNLQHGTHWARIAQPDVIILDTAMPSVSAAWSVAMLREAAPAARFILLADGPLPGPLAAQARNVEFDTIGPNDPVEKLLKAARRTGFRPALASNLFPRLVA